MSDRNSRSRAPRASNSSSRPSSRRDNREGTRRPREAYDREDAREERPRRRADWSEEDRQEANRSRSRRPSRRDDYREDYGERVQPRARSGRSPSSRLWADSDAGIRRPAPAKRGRLWDDTDEAQAVDDGPWASWEETPEERRLRATGAFSRLPGLRRIRNTRLRVFTGVMLVAILLCSLGSAPLLVVAAIQYNHLSSLGNSGVKHLRTAATLFGKLGQNPVDGITIAQAHQELNAGMVDFNQLGHDLDQYPGALSAIPALGPRLSGIKKLIPIAVQGATAGGVACDALTLLSTRLRNPLDASSPGLTQTDLTTLGGYLDQAQATFDGVSRQINALTPSDLGVDPRIGPAVAQFRDAVPKIQKLLVDAKAFLGAAPLVMGIGAPTNYLIEVMDSTEIRPGGGFIGNYGTLTIAGGRLKEVHITDVDLLDRPFEARGGAIPKPPEYSFFSLVPNWSFRDSNLDGDFPTSAQNGMKTATIEGGPSDTQGVIALTPWLVQNAMRLTGPVTVTDYNETVTADTLVNAIHHHQLGANHGDDTIPNPESGSSQRKRFTALLFDAFFKQLKTVAAKDPGAFFKLVLNAIHSKDIQVFLKPEAAQQVLVSNHLASTIEAPATGDSLFIVDMNMTPNKANYFMANTAQDQVTLDADGVATHNLTLSFDWPKSQVATDNNYGVRTYYRDYLRIFAPPTSQLGAQTGWTSTMKGNRFNRAFWGGLVVVYYGGKGNVTLSWKVPNATAKTGDTWTYQYLQQRQAGITWKVNTQVTLPACAHITGKPEGLVTQNATTLGVNTDLVTDRTLSVAYTC